jgi:TnpA family transposase
VSLLEVLSTVQKVAHFLNEFEHWQLKYHKHRPPEKTFFAGIIGYGCDIGQSKIARISKQLNESELENTVNWYFSVPNLHAANDRVLGVLDRLELPNVYRRRPGKLHTSSDGQKFEIAVESLNANYSFEYFGQSKGVTVYSFIDERHLLFYSTVISSAEREAAYVIDGLLHNEVVKSDIHSTDTHGYGEVIFGATHLLGFTFAPRIKQVGRQRLYSFEKRKLYEDLGHQILPDGYIDRDLIAEHWDDILRFIATLRLKHTTASQLFKRLNSYSKQHPLYRASKEFGKIIKTIFILKYIDDPEFRQAIEKQLNKIESAQKFSKAISFGHNQEFIQSEKEELELAEGCRRLIKNAIISWNYLYLSQLLGQAATEARRTDLSDAIRNGSVVSWQHINLHGEYDFSDDKLQDSVGLDLPKIVGEADGKEWDVKDRAKGDGGRTRTSRNGLNGRHPNI